MLVCIQNEGNFLVVCKSNYFSIFQIEKECASYVLVRLVWGYSRHLWFSRCWTALFVAGNAYIMAPPKNTTANEGTRVKLNCQAEGYPSNITYRWFKNGEDVQSVSGIWCVLTWPMQKPFVVFLRCIVSFAKFGKSRAKRGFMAPRRMMRCDQMRRTCPHLDQRENSPNFGVVVLFWVNPKNLVESVITVWNQKLFNESSDKTKLFFHQMTISETRGAWSFIGKPQEKALSWSMSEFRPNPHRTRDATCAQIGTFFLWCCLLAVWTPLFTSTGPICLRWVARRITHPVWIRPQKFEANGFVRVGLAGTMPSLSSSLLPLWTAPTTPNPQPKVWQSGLDAGFCFHWVLFSERWKPVYNSRCQGWWVDQGSSRTEVSSSRPSLRRTPAGTAARPATGSVRRRKLKPTSTSHVSTEVRISFPTKMYKERVRDGGPTGASRSIRKSNTK